MHLSRRAWLAVAGGTLLAAGAAAVVWRTGLPGVTPGAVVAGAPAGYVDHEGWMLTPADKQALAQASTAAVESP